MLDQNIENLKQHFGIPDRVDFSTIGGLMVVQVTNPSSSAMLALQGAHLIDYQLRGEKIIWLSRDATFAQGKSIRGGIPICWPWFGAHSSHSDLPAHGYARVQPWELLNAECLDDETTQLKFEMCESATAREMFPQSARLQLTITVGDTLQLELTTTNTSDTHMPLSEALHSYFQVGDIAQVSVTGLDGCDYLDKVTGFDRKTQHGHVTIDGEVDRVYLNTHNRCEIVDPSLQRRIHLHTKASASTIVWNPGPIRAAEMGDMGEHGYQQMLCVESGNAAENSLILPAGEQHTLRLTIESEAL